MELEFEINERVVRDDNAGSIVEIHILNNSIIYKVLWDNGLLATYKHGLKLESALPYESNYFVLKRMNFTVWNTGGNCTAFGLTLDKDNPHSDYVLVTAVEDPSIPEPFDTKALFCIYDHEGEPYYTQGKLIKTEHLANNILFHIRQHVATKGKKNAVESAQS